MMYVSEHPPLHKYIGCRMQDHFEMVERYGFGNFRELLTTAEESMCEIWIASLDALDRDISSWLIDLPSRQNSGLLLPPWLLRIGLRIMPVFRPILALTHVIAPVRIAGIALILAAVIMLAAVVILAAVVVFTHVPVPSFALEFLLAISTLHILILILALILLLMALLADITAISLTAIIDIIISLFKLVLIRALGPVRVLGPVCVLEIVLRMVIVPYLVQAVSDYCS